jgi:hypothetical protein
MSLALRTGRSRLRLRLSAAARPFVAVVIGFVIGFVIFARSSPASAHDFRPAVLSLKETSEGTYSLRWSPPRARMNQATVSPIFPADCEESALTLACGPERLRAAITFSGLSNSNVEVVVTLEHLDGSIQTQVLSSDDVSFDPTVQKVHRSSAKGALAKQYFGLGLRHILEGFDHLMFVTGLILIVGFRRRLFWTITAFTAAHSITLAASILQLVHLASAPVEFVIALSIVLVAREALDDRPSLTRRFPWAVAFVFGLIHGFGFSGALTEIGLPAEQVTLPLLTFNLGVEAGQLSVVAVLGLVSIPASMASKRAPWLRTAFIYAMGITAAYWSIERLFALMQGT